MKKMILILITLLIITGCALQPEPTAPTTFNTAPSAESTAIPTESEPEAASTEPGTQPPSEEQADIAEEILNRMTLEEMVGQLFLCRCPEENAIDDILRYHPGGFILFSRDFENETPMTLAGTVRAYQAVASVPMLMAVDEEGGAVTRISRYSAFRESPFPSPRSLYSRGGLELLLETEEEKCQMLWGMGINVNIGPVCDISTNPGDYMYSRSLGLPPDETAYCVESLIELMDDWQIGNVLKHFPGYGGNPDTHEGIAVDSRPLEQLEKYDLIPFAAGMDAGCDAVLVSHTVITCLDPDYPASLSPAVHQYLRDDMNFDGVIMTDDLFMDAIAQVYGVEEAAVLAVLAGNDLLCSTEYPRQYAAVLQAVQDGRISQEMIRSAALRILRWKADLGLLDNH